MDWSPFRSACGIVGIAWLSAGASVAQAAALAVYNPSFETPAFGDGGYAFGVTVAQQGGKGWNISFDGGFVYNPQAGDYTGAAGSGTPQGAAGAQVAGLFGPGDYSIYQTLIGADGVPANSDDPRLDWGTTYTLTLEVGQRALGNPFGASYGGYTVELLAGNPTLNPIVVGSASDVASPPPPGTFVTRTIVFDCPTYEHPEAAGLPLTIRLRKPISNATSTVEYDEVRLDATKVSPELNADFNESGGVTGADLAAWTTQFGATCSQATHEHGNANGDDYVDGADFLAWQRQLGSVPATSVAAPSAGAVPEPSALVLALAAAVGVRRRFGC